MIRILGFYKRRPEISPEEFRTQWAIHGDMVRNSTTISNYIDRYIQHFLTPTDGAAADFPYDGFSEVWCESVERYVAMRTEPEHVAMGDHTRQFIDVAASRTVIDEPATVV